MADIRYLARTQDGQLYWAVGPQANVPLLIVTTPPGVVGVPEPGQTVTITGGVYEPPGMTRISLEVTLRDASGNIVEVGTTETFSIPQDAGSGTLTVEETMLHAESGITIIGTARVEVISSAGAPVFQSRPTISYSDPTPGGVISSSYGTVTGSPAPTITRQWLRDGVVISGATGATYTATETDVGKAIRVRNTATNSAGTAVVESEPVYIVAPSQTAPAFTGLPTISNDPNNAEFVVATNAPVSGAPTPQLTNKWYYRDGTSGPWEARLPTNDPYRWRPDPSTFAGKYITCATVATNEVGTAESGKASDPIRIPPVEQAQEGFTAQPSLSAEGSQPIPQGATVTLNPGTWHGSPTEIEYLWFRIAANGSATALSTSGLTRTVGELDGGNKIGARVRIKYSTGSEFFGPSATGYTNQISVAEVTGPVDPEEPVPPGAWPVPTNIDQIISAPVLRFIDSRGVAQGANANYHMFGLAAYNSWRGDSSTDNTVRARFRATLTSADHISPRMGYGSAYIGQYIGGLYFISHTPRIFNSLTATERQQLDLIFKMTTIAAMACGRNIGDELRNMMGEANASNISGESNPNIRCSHYLIPFMAAAYFDGASKAKAYFGGLSKADIVSMRNQATNLGLPRIARCFAESRPSRSPSWDRIMSLTNNYVTGNGTSAYPRITWDNIDDLFFRELNFAYNRTTHLGLNNGTGTRQHTRPKEGEGDLQDNFGRGRFQNVNTVSNTAAWKSIEGKVGMSQELNTHDDNGGERSSMSYESFNEGAATVATLVALASGIAKRSDPRTKALGQRLQVNVTFCKLADQYTYLSCAKTLADAGFSNSESWSLSGHGSSYRIPVRRGIQQAVVNFMTSG